MKNESNAEGSRGAQRCGQAAMFFDLSSNFTARRATSNSQSFDRREIATRGRR